MKKNRMKTYGKQGPSEKLKRNPFDDLVCDGMINPRSVDDKPKSDGKFQETSQTRNLNNNS